MLSFESDYNNGAHPQILRRLVETNDLQSLTYGFDQWSESARSKIRVAAQCPDASVYFLTGGTQTNMTVIDGCLKSYEAVIAVETGHISIHEASAIEFTGHKVITLPHHDGKMSAADLKNYMQWFVNDQSRDHLAQPGMVYITYPTEFGTVYTKDEIEEIYDICQQYQLLLFVDGARLGYGLMVEGSEVTNLYFDIARHAITMAIRLRETLRKKGYRFFLDSPSNQQFVILPNDKVKALSEKVEFTIWQPYDADSQVCRFVTSWATTEEQLAALESYL